MARLKNLASPDRNGQLPYICTSFGRVYGRKCGYCVLPEAARSDARGADGSVGSAATAARRNRTNDADSNLLSAYSGYRSTR
jgi:hypothetical protein